MDLPKQTLYINNSKGRTIKCVVWDLDNTLWSGILSENDVVKISKEAIKSIKELDKYGILHSVSSRNNSDQALAKLEEFGIREYFLFPQIHWGSKSEAIKKIAEKLNIGLEAIAFIDDQAFERDEVNFVIPSVTCLDVDVIPDLPMMLKPEFITDESALRRAMYQSDEKRNLEEQQVNDNEKFLASLGMKLTVKPAALMDLERVQELTIRTHQLNATGYTYSYDELREFINSNKHKILVAELTDKYGTYGKVGILMVHCADVNWTIKLLLVSCRVMSRGIGSVLLQTIIAHASKSNLNLFAEFLPTDRNRIMYITYKLSGFTEHGTLENGGLILRYASGVPISTKAHVEVEFLT